LAQDIWSSFNTNRSQITFIKVFEPLWVNIGFKVMVHNDYTDTN
jgi:hypothetical protein